MACRSAKQFPSTCRPSSTGSPTMSCGDHDKKVERFPCRRPFSPAGQVIGEQRVGQRQNRCPGKTDADHWTSTASSDRCMKIETDQADARRCVEIDQMWQHSTTERGWQQTEWQWRRVRRIPVVYGSKQHAVPVRTVIVEPGHDVTSVAPKWCAGHGRRAE